ncbi:MAG: HAD-IC family P-type ATPase [Methanosarcinales archaeon]
MAVVFDSAGTLLNMHRVIKDIEKGKLIYNIVSTDLVSRRPKCALVVLQTDPETIMKSPKSQKISDFIKDHNIKIDVSCASSPITKKEVLDTITKDNTTVEDLQQVLKSAEEKCKENYYSGVGIIVNLQEKNIPYVIGTCGRLFLGVRELMEELKKAKIDLYIASGDSTRNLMNLANCLDIPKDKVFSVATPKVKENIIKELKKKYKIVIMVGNGINDLLAIKAADIGILTLQQAEKTPAILCKEADVIIKNIYEVLDIVLQVDRT